MMYNVRYNFNIDFQRLRFLRVDNTHKEKTDNLTAVQKLVKCRCGCQ